MSQDLSVLNDIRIKYYEIQICYKNIKEKFNRSGFPSVYSRDFMSGSIEYLEQEYNKLHIWLVIQDNCKDIINIINGYNELILLEMKRVLMPFEEVDDKIVDDINYYVELFKINLNNMKSDLISIIGKIKSYESFITMNMKKIALTERN